MGKLELKNREIDEFGRVAFNEDGLVALLKAGKQITGASVLPGDWVSRYQTQCELNDETDSSLSVLDAPTQTLEEFDEKNQKNWFIPDEYKKMDVLEYLISQCSTVEQAERIEEEWLIYEERDLIDLLRLMIFLIDTFRANGIVWGVGRGSSVSSYILFLIGVHKIDSLKYGLDIKEFLK